MQTGISSQQTMCTKQTNHKYSESYSVQEKEMEELPEPQGRPIFMNFLNELLRLREAVFWLFVGEALEVLAPLFSIKQSWDTGGAHYTAHGLAWAIISI